MSLSYRVGAHSEHLTHPSYGCAVTLANRTATVVAERNSMIDGVPAFDEALPQSIRRDLEAILAAQAPRRSA
jgi:hypothetical protein